MPRTIPLREREWLSCTNGPLMPSSSNTFSRNVSAKNPRSSPNTLGFSSSGPSRRVGSRSIPAARLSKRGLDLVGHHARDGERRGGRGGGRVAHVQGALGAREHEVVV